MTKNFTGLSLVIMAAFATSAVGRASTDHILPGPTELTKALSGHMPPAVSRMSDLGKLDDQKLLTVTLALSLNHEDELDQLIGELYRPGSLTYHQFITPQIFRDRYAPTDDQVAKERAFLQSEGLVVQDSSENRVLLHAEGTVAQLNQIFQTELHEFRRADGQTSFAPVRDPRVPGESRITTVVGLNNVGRFHRHLHKRALADEGTGQGTGPSGGLAPADLITAYEIPASANGQGQTLALFELTGYDPSDIATYEQQFKLPNVPLRNILLDGSDGTPGSGSDEVTLDIEIMVALAPQATSILVYEGPNSDQGAIDLYAKIANDNLAQQISTSWGQAEDQLGSAEIQAENPLFKQMVAQGQSLYAASGDLGANDDGSQPSVDDPSSQPYVIGVGGTTLTLGAGQTYASETSWNDDQGSGGGGISTVWNVPSWQKGAFSVDAQGSAQSSLQSSLTMRNVPDVSLNSDPVTGYAVYIQGAWQVTGGTSAAAPMWAAFTALVNQQRATAGLTPIGFMNPALYAIGEGANYSADFHDIADGSGNKGFTAVKGYDNVTGWGTIRGSGLFPALTTDPAPSPAPLTPKVACGL